MKKVLLTVFLASTYAHAAILHNCVPENPRSAGFNYVQISQNRNQYAMAIEWNVPIGREEVEEVSAEYYDDFSMTGYFAQALNATLEVYDSSDFKGQRVEFKMDKRQINVKCRANRRR